MRHVNRDQHRNAARDAVVRDGCFDHDSGTGHDVDALTRRIDVAGAIGHDRLDHEAVDGRIDRNRRFEVATDRGVGESSPERRSALHRREHRRVADGLNQRSEVGAAGELVSGDDEALELAVVDDARDRQDRVADVDELTDDGGRVDADERFVRVRRIRIRGRHGRGSR